MHKKFADFPFKLVIRKKQGVEYFRNKRTLNVFPISKGTLTSLIDIYSISAASAELIGHPFG